MDGQILAMTAIARGLAMKKRRPYGMLGPNGTIVLTTGGDVVVPKMRTGAIPPQVLAARERAGRARTAGGCGCGPNSGCPTPDRLAAAGDNIAIAQRRTIAGRGGKCDYAPLTFSDNVAAGGNLDVFATSSVLICPEKMVLISAGAGAAAGFLITTLQFGNRPQFAQLVAGAGLHSFAFGADATQVIPFKGDCLDTGTPFTLRGTNLDAANAQDLYGFLMGPMQGM